MLGSPLLRTLFLAAASFALAACAGGPPQALREPGEAKPFVVPPKPVVMPPTPPRPIREYRGSPEGKRIDGVEIRFTGPTTVDEARLRAFISTRAGQPYVSEKVDNDIKSLYESGYIDDVRVLAEPAGTGLLLMYEVSLRPPIGPSLGTTGAFVGNTAFPDQRLAIETGLAGGQKASPDVLARSRKKLEAYYHSHGYPKTKVELAWDGEDFSFQIEEGVRTGN